MTIELLRVLSTLWCVAFIPANYPFLCRQQGSFDNQRHKHFLWQSCAVLQENYMIRRRFRRRRRQVSTYSYHSKKNCDINIKHCPHWETGLQSPPLHGLIIQSGDSFSSTGDYSDEALAQMLEIINRLAASNPVWTKSVHGSSASCIDILESFFLMYHNIRRSESISDFINQMLILFKLIYRDQRGAVLEKMVLKISKFFKLNFGARSMGDVQSGDFSEVVRTMRSCFDAGDATKSNPLFLKLRDLYSYLLTQGLLKSIGMELTEEEFGRQAFKSYNIAYSSKFDLWWCVLDTTITILERIDDFKTTGKFSHFVHGKDKYCDWLEKTNEILALAPYTGNLEAHGTNAFSFRADLDTLIEEGTSIVLHAKALTNTHNAFISSKLHALKMLKASEVTRKASQQERRAPFGVLVHGKSSIGKSSFTRMLYHYFGKLLNYETDDHFLYARSPTDEFWSGYDTSKWCIRLDDVAFLDPAKAMMDGTLEEILNVINNVPFNPPQASLEDKGKTPVRAELVIATTNRADLHADQYFSCPLAIMRRFKFIVHLQVKKIYQQDPIRTADGMKRSPFLDTDKIPEPDGFPDLWEIEVQRVVPDCRGEKESGKDYAQLEICQKFSDINEFLRFFGEQIVQHRTDQAKAMGTDKYMADLEICKKCYYPADVCKCMGIQSSDTIIPQSVFSYHFSMLRFFLASTVSSFIVGASRRILMCYTYFWCCSLSLRFLKAAGKYKASRILVSKCVLPTLTGGVQLSIIGGWCNSANKNKILGIVGLLSVCAAAYVASRYMSKSSKEHKERTYDYDLQGDLQQCLDDRFEKEAENNVWYNPTFEITTFDVPVASRSLAGKLEPELVRMLQRNCVHLLVRFFDASTGRKIKRSISGVFVKGQYLLTHNHAFPSLDVGDTYDVTLVFSNVTDGITPNLNFVLHQDDIVRRPMEDLAMVEIRSCSPFKNIMKYWCEKPLGDISKGFFVRRNANGMIEHDTVRKAVLQRNWLIDQLGFTGDLYLAELSQSTAEGQCGSLLVHATPKGPIISGLHLLGRGTRVGYLSVELSQIKDLILECENLLGTMHVCGGGEPMLNTPKTSFALGNLHTKSIIRYCEKGVANVYGGLKGFRPSPRSQVTFTPKKDEVCDYFNYKVMHGPPAMRGWEPWRNNLVDMVLPTLNHNRSELHSVASSFLNDIICHLPLGWEKRLHVLTNLEAVNGIPGVKFIDSINRSSSMGHPWCSSKKQYSIPAPSDEYPDGINFSEEVWDRVATMKRVYLLGERNFPVFTEHLKDEPVSLTKISAKKTRAFSGAPLDMALLVRQYYLSFVKLLQTHKFVFEAAPGTNPTSLEWTDFYKYLTKFGDHKMIAGDYAKYDKRMISDLVLEAFWIIIELHKKAGWDSDNLLIMWGLATDTAFPLVNFNGDLIEFFGTNPSGHPLTVIVNSLVNSLYMRWMYKRLNPLKECHSFKDNVALMTYGDDNIMGVSDETPWFNHTSVQSELATFGIVYTMADKESESVPYIGIDNCEFLKRKWRYDDHLGHHACPLNMASILKSLTVWTPSSSICAEEQFVNVVVSANMELFFHGYETFHAHHQFLKELVKEEKFSVYLPAGGLVNWDSFVAKFTSK